MAVMSAQFFRSPQKPSVESLIQIYVPAVVQAHIKERLFISPYEQEYWGATMFADISGLSRIAVCGTGSGLVPSVCSLHATVRAKMKMITMTTTTTTTTTLLLLMTMAFSRVWSR